ncbi:hypothetical protein N9H45_04480 [Opitutales bacterium]|nr:hypothetical protein [Opitutales bacterium]
MELKQCTKCKETKTIENFSFQKKENSYRSHCKACRNIDAKNSRDRKRGYKIDDYRTLNKGLKRCYKCKETLPATNDYFTRRAKSSDGFDGICRECKNKQKRAYRKANKEKIRKGQKKFYEANKTKVLESCKKYYETNKERVKSRVKKYREENKELAVTSSTKEPAKIGIKFNRI